MIKITSKIIGVDNQFIIFNVKGLKSPMHIQIKKDSTLGKEFLEGTEESKTFMKEVIKGEIIKNMEVVIK